MCVCVYNIPRLYVRYKRTNTMTNTHDLYIEKLLVFFIRLCYHYEVNTCPHYIYFTESQSGNVLVHIKDNIILYERTYRQVGSTQLGSGVLYEYFSEKDDYFNTFFFDTRVFRSVETSYYCKRIPIFFCLCVYVCIHQRKTKIFNANF